MYSETYGKQKITGKAKLKFYCQMCRKQCRDENGFKQHCNSDSHQHQMNLFNQNPEYFLNQFSQEFEQAFLTLLKDKYTNQTVSANKIYMELINNQDHVHMSGTKWTTLSGFCKHLQDSNKIYAEFLEDEKGVQISLNNQIPESISSKKDVNKKISQLEKEEKKMEQFIAQQVEKGNQLLKEQGKQAEQKIDENEYQYNGTEKISLDFQIKDKSSKKVKFNPLKGDQNKIKIENEEQQQTESNKQKKSKLEELSQKFKFQEENNTDQLIDYKSIPWIHEGIFVKIQDTNLKAFCQKKGIVKQVIRQFGAVVEMITENRERIQIDQEYLETVIPKIGNQAMILKPGPFKGKIGKLESIHQDNFSGSIYIEEENILVEMPYELFSKVVQN